MKISKETFVNAVDGVMKFEDRIFDLNELGVDLRDMVEETDLSDIIITVLDEITNKSKWVQTYAYDLDFGRDCETDTVTFNDEEVEVYSTEALYNSLVKLEEESDE